MFYELIFGKYFEAKRRAEARREVEIELDALIRSRDLAKKMIDTVGLDGLDDEGLQHIKDQLDKQFLERFDKIRMKL